MPELPSMKYECLTYGETLPPSLCPVLQKAMDES